MSNIIATVVKPVGLYAGGFCCCNILVTDIILCFTFAILFGIMSKNIREVFLSYPEYYNELGVSPSADMKEIKRAYYKLAKKYHPDLNPGDKKAEEKLKKINAAYDVLGDMAKRAEYDYFGKQAEKAAQEYQSQAPVYRDEQPIYRNETAQTETPPQQNVVKSMSLGRFIFNRAVILLIFFGYLAFLHSNVDKSDPTNIQKMMNNSSAVLVEKIKSVKDWASDKIMKGEWKKTFLFMAVKYNWTANLGSVLEMYPDAQIVDEKGYSLLMYAPSREIAEILLYHGADVNYVAPDKETPYSQATRNNRQDVIDFLIENGLKTRLVKPTKKPARPSRWNK